MHYGILDIEMTCDGKQEDGKFIDDGRMKHSQREIISVGFLICDDMYKVKDKYDSIVKPAHNSYISNYCKNLTGITQKEVMCGKKCNNAFGVIEEMCMRYSVNYIFVFGDADKAGIRSTVRWNKKEGEKTNYLNSIEKKIIDVRPTILDALNYKEYQKGPGLSKIGELLKIKSKGRQHNALSDAILLYEICKKIDIQIENNN